MMLVNKQSQIVVIDDSRASVTMCAMAVEPLAVDLTSFESPKEGFEYLQNNDADLIFLGNLMRETDGLSLLRKVRELSRHAMTPVIVMSTKDYDQDRAMAKKFGALEYLVKPVRAQVFREAVEKYIQLEKLEQ
jgi:PleD family two-component response regulator